MTATLEPPPTHKNGTSHVTDALLYGRPANGAAPAPARYAPPEPVVARPARDVPWSPAYEDENPAGITRSVAVTFALFGLTATLFLGALLGANVGLFRLPGLVTATGGAAASAPVTLDVSAAEFKLTPSDLHMATPGQLTIKLTNNGVIEHDLTIEGVDGKADAKPGSTTTGVFQIKKAGTYSVYCSIPGHREAGMQGTLHVGA